MKKEQLKEAIQYNLDYLEGNIDFELEYKELSESYSELYEELEAKSKMLVNRDKELITFSDEIERLNKRILTLEETIRKANNNVIKDIAMIKTHEMTKQEIVQRLIETSRILENGSDK